MKRAKPKRYLKCCTGVGKINNLKIQLIEYANVPHNLLKQELWHREKFWKRLLFTLSHEENPLSDCYSCQCILVNLNDLSMYFPSCNFRLLNLIKI